jgi:alkanesulfonate monooxygenase SsuD/methylene tetrahydromethanopterin reductase-like flavin-dependent oxidoreductase (luciferase family)
VKFGLFGGAVAARPSAAQKGDAGFSEVSIDSSGYLDFIEFVRVAEELDYHSVFVVEHHFTGTGQLSASLNLLTYLAAITTRIRLGTAVAVLPWHNPVLLAEQAATLDLLSNGRLDFGIGKGYRDYEFRGFCIPREEATARFEESVAVIRKAWTSNERFSHDGKFWKFADILVEPPTVQRPHPPLWLAAVSENSIRKAAREGFNLLLDQLASIDLIVERKNIFRDECHNVGRRFDPMSVAVTRGLYITRNQQERSEALEQRREAYRRIGGLAGGRDPDRYAHPDRLSDEEMEADDSPLLGTPAEIAARLRRLEDGGIRNVLLVQPSLSTTTLRQFAGEIASMLPRSVAAE